MNRTKGVAERRVPRPAVRPAAPWMPRPVYICVVKTAAVERRYRSQSGAESGKAGLRESDARGKTAPTQLRTNDMADKADDAYSV